MSEPFKLTLSTPIPTQEKNIVTAIALWFFLGWASAHHFYAERIGKGIGMLLLSLIGYAALIVLIGFVFILIWFAWWIIDGISLLTRLGKSQGVNETQIREHFHD